eukprot:m.482449 g.482449  ORF g.482449 m.482449 type:complete len:570 (-) comp22548_c0_seq1:88-1797(-)
MGWLVGEQTMLLATTVALAVVFSASPAASSTYRGRLALHPFSVGGSEQVTVTLGGIDAENRDGCVISWVSLLNYSTPQYYESDAPFDGDNASAYHSEIQWSTEEMHDDSPTQRAYASVYTEARCGVPRLMHSVLIRNCTVGQPFNYRVRVLETNDKQETHAVVPWSQVYQARLPDRSSKAPLSVGIVADMDAHIGTAIDALAKGADSGDLDLAVHAGDIAYNLDDDCGTNGDTFFNALQKVATKIPYVFAPGDHEEGRKVDAYGLQTNGFDYEGFRNRLGHATNAGQLVMARWSGSTSLDFFSFNTRHVHWIVVNTNLYLQPQLYQLLPIQYAWLQRDLASVNRTETPWIVVSGHRQMYCVKTTDNECNSEALSIRQGIPTEAWETLQMAAWFPYTDKTPRSFGLEDLFIKHGVDFYLAGHTHHYQRTWPVRHNTTVQKNNDRAGATVYVTLGRCSNESKDPFDLPMADWEAYRDTQLRVGYSHLTFYNATHARFEQRLVSDPKTLIDAFSVTKRVAADKENDRGSSGMETASVSLGVVVLTVVTVVVAVYVMRRRSHTHRYDLLPVAT